MKTMTTGDRIGENMHRDMERVLSMKNATLFMDGNSWMGILHGPRTTHLLLIRANKRRDFPLHKVIHCTKFLSSAAERNDETLMLLF